MRYNKVDIVILQATVPALTYSVIIPLIGPSIHLETIYTDHISSTTLNQMH